MKTYRAFLLIVVLLAAAFALYAEEPAPMNMSLKDAVAQAIERNLDIAVSRLSPLSGAEDIIIADSVFDSSFTAQGSWARSQSEPTSGFSSTSNTTKSLGASYLIPFHYGASVEVSFDHTDSSSDYPSYRQAQFGLLDHPISSRLTATYSQSLLRNFGLEVNRTGIEQAQIARQVSEDSLKRQVEDIVAQTESGYWTLVGAQKQLGVARASLDLALDFLRQTKIKVDVGILPPIEITTAEAEVASREEGVIVSENAVRNSEDVLRALMRIPESSPDWGRPIRTTDEPGFTEVKVDGERAIEEALMRRTEISSAKLSIRSADLNRRYRENQVKPDLALQAVYGLSGNNFDYVDTGLIDPDSGAPILRLDRQGRWESVSEIPSRDNNNWSVGMVLKIPVRNRAAKAELAKAKLNVDEANLKLEAVRQTLKVEVRQAVRNLETASRRVATTRANVILQRKKLDAEQKRYENGLSTPFQVLQYQTDLRDAESREVDAIIEFNKALVQFAKAKGSLLEERGVKM